MKRDQFNVLVESMKGKDTTHGWDVVVSYDEDKINDFLEAHPISAIESLPPFRGTGHDEDDSGQVVAREYEFDIKLRSPKLQFIGRHGLAKLDFTITGTYKRHPSSSASVNQLPDGYQASIGAELYNVLGTLNDAGGNRQFISPPSSHQSGPNNATDVQLNSARGVYLSLKEPEVHFQPQGGKISSAAKDALRDGLRNYLQQGTQEYLIAGVAGYDTDPSMIAIRPARFCFTVTPKDEDGTPGFLSMWIGVEGGHKNGLQPSGMTTLAFQPGGTTYRSPIPSQTSASIIFSHDIMAGLFLKPNLEGFLDDVKVTSFPGTGGMEFTGCLKHPGVKIPAQHTEKDIGYRVTEISDYDGFNFTVTNPPATVTVKPGITTSSEDAILISYKSKPETSEWSVNYKATEWAPPPKSGAVSATLSWKAKGQWIAGTQARPNLIGLTMTPDQNWSLNASETDHSNFFTEWANKINGGIDVPDHYEGLQPPAVFNLTMRALDYFLTTNLLFPGRQMFKAHIPVASAHANEKGLAVPRDLILTGDITSS
ncbi:hypothetical protein APSETT444_003739 [Aspergillus pseudonomiae]